MVTNSSKRISLIIFLDLVIILFSVGVILKINHLQGGNGIIISSLFLSLGALVFLYKLLKNKLLQINIRFLIYFLLCNVIVLIIFAVLKLQHSDTKITSIIIAVIPLTFLFTSFKIFKLAPSPHQSS